MQSATVILSSRVLQGPVTARDVLDALFRKKRIILTGCLLFTAAIVTYTMLRPSEYESEMLLMMRGGRVRQVVTADATPGAPVSDATADSKVQTAIQLLQSADLHRQVVQRMAGGKSLSPAELELAVRKYSKHLRVAAVPKTNLIKLTFVGKSSQEAAKSLQSLKDQFLAYDMNLQRNNGTYEFFGQQAELYLTKLKEAQEQLAAFEQNTKISLLIQQKDITLRKMADTRASLDEARASAADYEQRVARINSTLEGTSARVTTQRRTLPNQYSAERLNTLLVELQNKRTELLTKFRPEDRLVKELDQQIADTRGALDKATQSTSTEEATDLNPIRQSLELDLTKSKLTAAGLHAREKSLNSQIQSYQDELSHLDRSTARHDQLLQTVKDAEENYQLYSKKREEARIDEALDQHGIADITIASGPSLPALANPRWTLATICAIALGNLMIFGIALVTGMRRSTICLPWELDALTNIPVLATIPYEKGSPRAALPEFVNTTF